MNIYEKLVSALTSPHTLGGVLALSTWLPLSTAFPKVGFLFKIEFSCKVKARNFHSF